MSPLPHRLRAVVPSSGPGRIRRVGLRGALADANRVARHEQAPGEVALPGMTWQEDDRTSERWYPQGITTSADAYGPEPSGGRYEGHDVVLVSWYGRGVVGRLVGSRISAIDWHDDEPPRYRHLLLVDRTRRWGWRGLRAVRVHAGGIVWYGDHLFVAGSRAGIRVFRLDDVVRVRNRFRSKGYRYVLPQALEYRSENDADAPRMTYSFMSLERSADGHRLVVGEYGRKDAPTHRLLRFPIDPETGLLDADRDGQVQPLDLHDRQLPRMQGAVVADGTWFVTASSGEDVAGDLWAGQPGEWTHHRRVLPTGPEDITYLPQRRQLWTLTEWPGRRWVFPVDADRWR